MEDSTKKLGLGDCPKEVIAHIAHQVASGQDASAFMRTCREIHELLALELHKDLPVIQLSTLIGGYAPMTVGYFKKFGAGAKNLILHHNHVDVDFPADWILKHTLRDLLDIFEDSNSLEVFGFNSASSITDNYYELIARLLKSNISLRILILPENIDKDWRSEVETLFAAHIRLRRGDPEPNKPQSYGGAQADRKRPTTKGEGRGRKNFDVYFHNGCDIDTIKVALSQPGNIVEEANIFGGLTMTSEAAVEDWQDMCERMGMDTEELKELGLYSCMVGPVSPLANLKVSRKLGALTIVNSISRWDIVDAVELPEEMKKFSTEELLAKIEQVHSQNKDSGMYKFVYRQNIRNGTANNPNDPISNEKLKRFIRHSSQWRILCIQHNLPYDGKMSDFARATLEYGSFRFANQEFTSPDIRHFAVGSPNLRWLGLNLNMFTRVVREPELPTEFADYIMDKVSPMRTLRKLEVLCVYTAWPGRGCWLDKDNNLRIDKAIAELARELVKQKKPLKYIHLVVRDVDVDADNWHKVRAAITYSVHKTSPAATVSRLDTLPNSVYEDLETMGGGTRRWMKQLVRDVLGHLYVNKEGIQERDAARAQRKAGRAETLRLEKDKAGQVAPGGDFEPPVNEDDGEDSAEETEGEEHSASAAGTKRKASEVPENDQAPSSSKSLKLGGGDE
ncbi:hypothetical protein P171DRAFT_525924 [Karstenula rhodostoma CBS 690.94]|uniref:Uncharacterized protein n=1 Tax=Karstenula rhodostoma CBS 690.94 TaxID=1392251 RepID=A0A9P4P7C7_9PLEO|nr:hypothetical protein P171DRAFT_525924 [Karstenula rhodostoma CBS 690.94]